MGATIDPGPTPGWPARALEFLRRWHRTASTPDGRAPRADAPAASPPRAADAVHAAPSPLEEPSRIPTAVSRPLRQPCVLVVDDNPVNLELACGVLEELGAGPVLAGDGAEAVALALELRPDLVLMDLQMPVLDGIEATRQIRRFEREHGHARVPVVAFTSNTQVDTQRLLLCGFDGVLHKPCEEPALLECLQRWCPPAAGVPGRQAGGPL